MRPPGLLVMKVRMWAEIRAVACGSTFEVNCADEVAVNQRLEAIVDRCQGNGRKLRLYADEHFVRRGVVTFLKEHVVNHLSLGGRAEAAIGEPLGKRGRVGGCRHGF